jgi:hypothetical protein
MRVIHLCLFLASSAAAHAQVGLWSQLQFPVNPTPRYGSMMVYDSARDRLVLLSGTFNAVSAVQETWENDGSQWVLRGPVGPAAAPFGQVSVRAVYDSARQRVIGILSEGGGVYFEHWEWDGATWTLRPTPTRPAPRYDFALAYDSVRQRTILHGGNSGPLGVLADTWEFDGNAWTQRSSGGPQNRMQHSMAFDAARGVTVLFGGHRSSTPAFQYGDTWVWNGSYWFEHYGAQGPAPRSAASMVWDGRRQRIVLTGGRSVYGGSVDYNDTWEWDGQQWTDMQAPQALGNLLSAAFDTLRGRTVVFGGSINGTASNQTWSYFGTGAPLASIAPYGAGCAGPTGVPALSVVSGSPRLGSSVQLRLSNLPTNPFHIPLAWIGFDNTQWNGVPLPLALDAAGFPGCTALLAPEQAFSFTNTNGIANFSISVPFLPAFAGLPFYVQGGVLVSGFNTGGLVFTNGLAARIGR